MNMTISSGSNTYVNGADQRALYITARSVHLIDGHVGQVVVEGVIAWQSKPKRTELKARAAAVRRIAAVLA